MWIRINFLDFSSYDSITVIEPAEMFYNKAIEDIDKAKNKNVTVIKELLENSLPQIKDKNLILF